MKDKRCLDVIWPSSWSAGPMTDNTRCPLQWASRSSFPAPSQTHLRTPAWDRAVAPAAINQRICLCLPCS
eukprot:2605212-Amphidinium_carterae.2